jgi:fatty-acyl-CoA synthase
MGSLDREPGGHALMPFAPAFPIRTAADVRRLEATPMAEAVAARSTYDIFCASAKAFGEKTALTFLPIADPACQPLHWSYAQLLQGIHQTANLLHGLGLQAGDCLAVLMPACPQYHLALWGGEAAGIVLPLNPLLSEEKLASLLNAGQAKALLAWQGEGDADLLAKALRLRAQVPSLQHVIRVSAPECAGQACPEGVLDFAKLSAGQPGDRLLSGRQIARTDIAAYFHTGGTTGAPKLARHSHGAQVFTAWACVQMQGTLAQDVVINGYPLFHVAGVLPGALASFSAGSQVIMPTTQLFRNRAVMNNYWRLVERFRATVVSAVPTVLAGLTQVPVGDADIASLRYCRTGAAPLSPDLAARFEALFGLHVHESFGMTEMAGISSITPPGVTAPVGCVGFRIPFAQCRVVALDAQGAATEQDQPQGATGMVLFKSPNVFSGFVDPKDNAGVITDQGWLVTGDLGWLDDQERLHLSGRSKDLIIRGGHNIDPKTIEDAMASHPAVQHCAAVGAPDAYAGELPVVFVTLKPSAGASEEELLAHVCARVDEPPARPKSVTILEAMPMTLVGKIFKPELRAMAAEAVKARQAGG